MEDFFMWILFLFMLQFLLLLYRIFLPDMLSQNMIHLISLATGLLILMLCEYLICIISTLTFDQGPSKLNKYYFSEVELLDKNLKKNGEM